MRDTARERVTGLYERHVNVMLARLAQQEELPVEARSAGTRVIDSAGREYLDCGGFAVFLLGHRHPAVVEALHKQLDRHPLASRGLLSAELATAAHDLASVAPAGLDYVYFGSTGSEAAETAIKLARAGGRRILVSMRGGFHGKTLGALSVTDRPLARRPFRPLLPDTHTVPYGDGAALDALLAGLPEPACVLVEPVQGEGGVRVPPPGYLRTVAESCRRHGAMLVVDEIQTGMGRLGTWWGCDAEQIAPDVILAGKGLGGGCVPASAVIATADAFEPFNRGPRLHSSTFSGAPLLMAAVSATIAAIRAEDILARTARLGATLLSALRDVTAAYRPDIVTDVRGKGLLLGVELASPGLVTRFTTELLHRGVIITNPVSSHKVARICPPAVMSDVDLEWLLEAIRDTLTKLGTT